MAKRFPRFLVYALTVYMTFFMALPLQVLAAADVQTLLQMFGKVDPAKIDPEVAKSILKEFSSVKNNYGELISSGVSKEQLTAVDNWKRDQLKKAMEQVTKGKDVSFDRMGSSSKASPPGKYKPLSSDDDIIPFFDKKKYPHLLDQIDDQFKSLTGIKCEVADINFLEMHDVTDMGKRATALSSTEHYTTIGGNKRVKLWRYEKGSRTYWKNGKLVEVPYKQLGPPPPPMTADDAFGYATDNIRQMNLNYLSDPGLSPEEKVKKLCKYMTRNEEALEYAGMRMTAADREILDLARRIDNNPKLVNSLSPDRTIRRIVQTNDRILKELHNVHIKQIGAAYRNGNSSRMHQLLDELAGSYQNVVGQKNSLAAIKRMLAAVDTQDDLAKSAVYTALIRRNDLADVLQHIRDLNLDDFHRLAKIETHLTKSSTTATKYKATPSEELALNEPYKEEALKHVSYWDDIKHIPEAHWMTDIDDVVKAYEAERFARIADRVQNAYGTVSPEKNSRIARYTRAHLRQEYAESIARQHKRYVSLKPQAQEQIKRSSRFMKHLAKFMTDDSTRGIIKRNFLMSAVIFSAYAFYASDWDPAKAWELTCEAAPEIAKSTAVFTFLEYFCKQLLPSKGMEGMGQLLWKGVMIAVLVQLLSALTNAGFELYLGSVLDEPLKKSMFRNFLEIVREMNPKAYECIGGDINKLYPCIDTPEKLKSYEDAYKRLDYDFRKDLGYNFYADNQRDIYQKFHEWIWLTWLETAKKAASEQIGPITGKPDHLQEVLLADPNGGACTLGIFSLKVEPEQPKPGETFKVIAEYIAFGLAGKTLDESITFTLKGAGKTFELTEKVSEAFKPDSIDPENISRWGTVAVTFKRPVPKGQYTVSAVSSSYPKEPETVVIAGTALLREVRIHVKDLASRKAIGNAEVLLAGDPGTYILPARRDEAYRDTVMPGSYGLEIQAPGYGAGPGESIFKRMLNVPFPLKEGDPPYEQTFYLAPTGMPGAASTAGSTNPTYNTSTVIFEVTDIARRPVNKAVLHLQGQQLTQDYTVPIANGDGQQEVVSDTYSYYIKSPDYRALSGSAVLTYDQTVPIEMGKRLTPVDKATKGMQKKYIKFTLSHDDTTVGYNKERYIQAHAWYSKAPFMAREDVTDQCRWQSTDDTLATIQSGVLKTGSKSGECAVSAEFTPTNSLPMRAVCRVKVADLDKPLPEFDFIVSPDKKEYKIGDRLTFTPTIKGNPDDYQFIWFIGDSRYEMRTQSYTFEEEGSHIVRLMVVDKDSRKDDAIAKSITVGAPVQPEVKISVNPEPPYTSPAKLIFSADCKGMPEPPEIEWRVNDDPKQRKTDDTFEYEFKGRGKYKINCIVSVTENGRKTRVIQPPALYVTMDAGDAAKPIAKWVNKFADEKAGDKLHITSSYWREGDHGTGDWTDPARIDTFDMPVDHILTTGEQDGGYNTGWFVWSNPDSGQLYYRVYGFNFARHLGRFAYNGLLDLKRKKYKEGTLQLLETKSRAITIQWDNTDGSRCKARIYKDPGSGKHDNNLFIQGGVEHLGCIELRKAPTEDTAEWDETAKFGIKIKWPCKATDYRIKLHIPNDAPPIFAGLKGVYDQRNWIDCDLAGKEYSRNHGVSDQAYWLNYGTHYLVQPYTKQIEQAPFIRLLLMYYNEDGTSYSFAYDNNFKPRPSVKHSGGMAVMFKSTGSQPYKGDPPSPFAANQSDTPETVLKELTYKNSAYPVRLQDGRLEVRGHDYPGYSWRTSWKTVSDGVKDFAGACCGQGPVIAYTRDNKSWSMVIYDYRSGARKSVGNFNAKPSYGSPGPYGFYFSLPSDGFGRCYEYSHGQLKNVDCFGIK